MKNRLAAYRHDENSSYDKQIEININGRRENVPCISKELYKKRDPKKVAGYIHKNNKQYTGKEYATLEGLSDDQLDIFSGKKFGECILGYIETADDEYIAITKSRIGLFILIAALAAAIIICICFAVKKKDTDNKPLTPVGELTDSEEEETAQTTDNILHARVALPAGGVDFSGAIDNPDDETAKIEDPSLEGSPYDGNITIKATMTVDETEYLLLDSQELSVEKGTLASTELDFTKLEFEVTPGVYDGTAHLTYPDGTEVDKVMDISVVSTVSGTLGVSYSGEADVDLANSTISMSYTPDNSPNDSYAQIILVSEGEEYILGESDKVGNNETVDSIALDETMKDKLQSGVYDGIMRIYIVGEESEDTVADIHTDIEISINVK